MEWATYLCEDGGGCERTSGECGDGSGGGAGEREHCGGGNGGREGREAYISVNGGREMEIRLPPLEISPGSTNLRHGAFTRLIAHAAGAARRRIYIYIPHSGCTHLRLSAPTANASGQLHNHRPSRAAAHAHRHARRPAEMQAARDNRPRSAGTQ